MFLSSTLYFPVKSVKEFVKEKGNNGQRGKRREEKYDRRDDCVGWREGRERPCAQNSKKKKKEPFFLINVNSLLEAHMQRKSFVASQTLMYTMNAAFRF